MELSFEGVNPAEAGALVRELELSLKKEGVPPGALSVGSTSAETMNPFDVLGVDLMSVLHALESVGYVAVFGHCIYELLGRHGCKIVVKTGDGDRVEFRSTDIDLEKIKTTLAGLVRPKPEG